MRRTRERAGLYYVITLARVELAAHRDRSVNVVADGELGASMGTVGCRDLDPVAVEDPLSSARLLEEIPSCWG
jgi:hypothetical protein